MRLWTRIRQVSSQAVSKVFSKVHWRALRGERSAPSDPDVSLMRDMVDKGTPMSLASVKAALDASASGQETKRPDVHEMKSLEFSAIRGSSTIFVG